MREYTEALLWAAREQRELARVAAALRDDDERMDAYRRNAAKGAGVRELIAYCYRVDEDCVRRDLNLIEEALRAIDREKEAQA